MCRKPYPILLDNEEVQGVLKNKEYRIVKAIRNPSTAEHKVRFDEAYSGYSIAGANILWCMHRNIADSWKAAIAWDSWYSVYPPRGETELLWVKEDHFREPRYVHYSLEYAGGWDRVGRDHMPRWCSRITLIITSVYPEKIDDEWCWIINVRKVEDEQL